MFEWHEEKRKKNIERHGYDFILAYELFAGDFLRKPAHAGQNGEERWMAIGIINGRYASAIYTMRGPTIRMISLRSARHEERLDHQKLFG